MSFYSELIEHIANDVQGASDGVIDKSEDLSVVDFLASKSKDQIIEEAAFLVDEPGEQAAAAIVARILLIAASYLEKKTE